MILVFCKYYNDLDQVIPAVYELARSGRRDIELVFLDMSYDLSNDFRVKFLSEKFNLKVGYFYNGETAGQWRFFLLDKIAYGPVWNFLTTALTALAIIGGGKFQKEINRLMRSVPKTLIKKLFGKAYAKRFLLKKEVSLIISDNRPRPVPLYKAVQELGIPMVGLPHGLNTANDKVTRVDEATLLKKSLPEEKEKFVHEAYSAFACQFEKEKERLELKGVPGNKIHVLGSTRYCPEWRERLGEITPAPIITDAYPGEDRLKVVLMDHASKYMMISEEIVRNVKAILELDYVDLVLKPSAGKMNTKVMKGDELADQDLLQICRVEAEEHSYNLIAWADVVLVTCSSIMLEVLGQGKTFIFPRHFTEWTGPFEDYKACWSVGTKEELVAALEKAHKEPGYHPYQKKGVDKLFEHMVFGHKMNRRVLEDHKKLFLEVEKNAREKSAIEK